MACEKISGRRQSGQNEDGSVWKGIYQAYLDIKQAIAIRLEDIATSNNKRFLVTIEATNVVPFAHVFHLAM